MRTVLVVFTLSLSLFLTGVARAATVVSLANGAKSVAMLQRAADGGVGDETIVSLDHLASVDEHGCSHHCHVNFLMHINDYTTIAPIFLSVYGSAPNRMYFDPSHQSFRRPPKTLV